MILEKDKVVRPIDVFIGMQLLSRDNLEEWRSSHVPYLEKVAAYTRPDRGQNRRLRFTKTGVAKLEKAYSTHFA